MLSPSVCRKGMGSRGLESLGTTFAIELGRAAISSDSRVTRVVVFGSYARGTASPSSDIDVSVFYDGTSRDSLDVVGNVAPAVWELCKQYGLECDVVAFANGSNEAATSPLASRICREGIDITPRDEFCYLVPLQTYEGWSIVPVIGVSAPVLRYFIVKRHAPLERGMPLILTDRK